MYETQIQNSLDSFTYWYGELEFERPGDDLPEVHRAIQEWLLQEGLPYLNFDHALVVQITVEILCWFGLKAERKPRYPEMFDGSAAWDFLYPSGFAELLRDRSRRAKPKRRTTR